MKFPLSRLICVFCFKVKLKGGPYCDIIWKVTVFSTGNLDQSHNSSVYITGKCLDLFSTKHCRHSILRNYLEEITIDVWTSFYKKVKVTNQIIIPKRCWPFP